MAVAETTHTDHHEHGEFIAHHFDSPEQQFDSGKLGIWVFLVTEVLFFSGLFVAYTLWRVHHPEIYQQAHVYLDKYLGALNTIVLLFSSLTIAWGVRSAQLGNNRAVANLTLITMVCAAMFLGVKAIEYSHKWDMGILVRSKFDMQNVHPEMIMGLSSYLVYMSIAPAILLGVFALLTVMMQLMAKPLWAKFWGGMVITVGGYFLGAVIGHYYMEFTGAGHSDHHGGGHGGHAAVVAESPLVLLAQETGAAATPAAADDHAHSESGHSADDHASDKATAAGTAGKTQAELDRDIGIFFSIYYCMTGLHAIHIIGGIIALSWIFYRSLAGHWRPDYFGPVDYVGLYWHLVDLIWIYLFPMLYLIE